MNAHDLLSTAIGESGIVDSTMAPQASTSFNVPEKKVETKDIKPFVLNGQYYYRTPKGVVQFKPGNKICIVSEFELSQAYNAERARKLLEFNTMSGVLNLAQIMNNNQPKDQFNIQPHLTQLANPALYINSKKEDSNQFLINHHANFGQLQFLEPEQLKMQPTMNAKLNAQSLFDSSSKLTQQQQIEAELLQQTANRRHFKNDFAAIYSQVVEEKPVDDEEETLFKADTYAEYQPSKLKIGLKHPDKVVETASLSSVQPPDVWYNLAIPEEVYDEKKLSSLQLECIVYASQQHEQTLPSGERAGFLIGDGAGVGKGRTIAGIIYENYLKNRKKAIWLSVSSDLKFDAERDLDDIGAENIKVHALNKLTYHAIKSKENGKIKKGVIFSTYSSLISESSTNKRGLFRSRLDQLIDWCGDDFEGVIVFDECHKAKNLIASEGKRGGKIKSTKTGQKVLELQQRLPNARIVYASATGATEPRNMAYMVRLGLWGKGSSFEEFNDFYQTVERRGVGAMELVAIDMKQRGMYMARQLSFEGVEFQIDNVKLSPEFVEMYNDCVDLWQDAKHKFDQALNLMEDDKKRRNVCWGQFWSAHQRFFKYLCIASKVDRVVQVTREELKNNNTVVIGLQSTGEARTLEALEESNGELNDFISTARAVFQSLIEKHFPAPNRKKSLALVSQLGLKSVDLKEKDYSNRNLRTARQETQKKIHQSVKFDDENEDSSTDEDSFIDDSDTSFEISDEEFSKRKSKKRKNNNKNDRKPLKKNKIEDSDDTEKSSSSVDEEDDQSEESEDDYVSLESEDDEMQSSSEEDESSDYSSDEEPWESYANNNGGKKKRSKNKKGKKKELNFGSEKAGKFCDQLRDKLIEKFDKIADRLPHNTIDDLINRLGGASAVAEMTGRKGRIVSDDNDEVKYESRKEDASSLEMLNIFEKNKFMSGEKEIAIISEAASSGISLQADRRVKNQKRRVHITIELPWSADRAIQQFGRTHRSNQTSSPKYIFMISNLAGEQRFATTVAKRLESLGALTHGDRRATETRDLSKFNLSPKYSRQALETIMNVVQGLENSPISPPDSYEGEDFFQDVRKSMVGVGLLNYDRSMNSYASEKDNVQIEKFLNRLLGMRVDLQNALFEYLAETMDTYIKHAKRTGTYDQGIMDLTSDYGQMERLDHQEFTLHLSNNVSKIELHKVSVERGISWEKALEILGNSDDPNEGFYKGWTTTYVRSPVFLAIKDQSYNSQSYSRDIYRIYKPNTGTQQKCETLSGVKTHGKKIKTDSAEGYWREIYRLSETNCCHKLWFDKCNRTLNNIYCDWGMRKNFYFILSGSILAIWHTIERVIPSQSGKLQIVRLRENSKDGKVGFRCVGVSIPQSTVDLLVKNLKELSNSTLEEKEKSFAEKEDLKPSMPVVHFDDSTDFSE